MDYWEVSAKNDTNVKEMFIQLTEKIVKDLVPKPLPDFTKEVDHLHFDSLMKIKSKRCC